MAVSSYAIAVAQIQRICLVSHQIHVTHIIFNPFFQTLTEPAQPRNVSLNNDFELPRHRPQESNSTFAHAKHLHMTMYLRHDIFDE